MLYRDEWFRRSTKAVLKELFFLNKMDLEAVQKHSLLRRIALVIPSKLSTNSQMIPTRLYFYLENASLFVMDPPCLTPACQELCLFSERASVPEKNRLLLCLVKIN